MTCLGALRVGARTVIGLASQWASIMTANVQKMTGTSLEVNTRARICREGADARQWVTRRLALILPSTYTPTVLRVDQGHRRLRQVTDDIVERRDDAKRLKRPRPLMAFGATVNSGNGRDRHVTTM